MEAKEPWEPDRAESFVICCDARLRRETEEQSEKPSEKDVEDTGACEGMWLVCPCGRS